MSDLKVVQAIDLLNCPSVRAHMAMMDSESVVLSSVVTVINRIATLEAEVARKDGALQELLDATDEPPEANCSCHTSPPCSDCIDFGHIREAIATARAALKPAKEG